MENIHTLKLHETIQAEDYQITRVAGGWIYRFWDYEKQNYYHDATFVPYSCEYSEEK